MSYYSPEFDLANGCPSQYLHYHFPTTFSHQDSYSSAIPRLKRSHSDGEGREPNSLSSSTSKRKRIPQSCIPCRLRKAKCDRKFPCGCCKKRREDSKCKYEDPSTIVQDHADLLRELLKTQEELARVNARSTSIVDQAVLEAALTLGGIGKCTEHDAVIPPESGVSLPHIYLALEIQEADPFKLRRLVLRITTQLVANKCVADMLLNRFFKVHPAAHFLIHFDSFLVEYEAFWKKSLSTSDKESVDVGHCPFWPAVMLSMFAVAARSYSRDDDPEWLFIKKTHGLICRKYRELLLKAVTRILLIYDYTEKYDLDVITVLVLNQYNSDIMTDKHLWVNVGIMESMAHGLSLSMFNPEYSAVDNLRRERLWDALQGSINFHAWDKSVLSHMDVGEIETLSVPLGELSTEISDKSFGIQWAQCYYRLSSYFTAVYKFLYQTSLSCTKAVHLDTVVRKNIVPNWFESSNSTTDLGLLWKRILLETTFNHLLLAIYLPFVKNCSRKYEFHKKAIEIAQSQMKVFEIFRKHSQQLASFSWFGGNSFLLSTLVATLLFALELASNESADPLCWSLVLDIYPSLRDCNISVESDQFAAVCTIIQSLLDEKCIKQEVLLVLGSFPGFDACGWNWALRYTSTPK